MLAIPLLPATTALGCKMFMPFGLEGMDFSGVMYSVVVGDDKAETDSRSEGEAM